MKLTKALYTTVSVVIALLILLLAMNLWTQYSAYHSAMRSLANGISAIDLTAAIVLARSYEFSVIKTCSLFLAFTLIFVGALYVLRQGEQPFEATVGSRTVQATLQTSSPGLVLVSLGVVLVIATLAYTSTVQVHAEQPVATTSESLAPAIPDGPTKRVP